MLQTLINFYICRLWDIIILSLFSITELVTQKYTPSQTITELQKQFTAMTDICITRAIDNNITSGNSLTKMVYRELSENFNGCYCIY